MEYSLSFLNIVSSVTDYRRRGEHLADQLRLTEEYRVIRVRVISEVIFTLFDRVSSFSMFVMYLTCLHQEK